MRNGGPRAGCGFEEAEGRGRLFYPLTGQNLSLRREAEKLDGRRVHVGADERFQGREWEGARRAPLQLVDDPGGRCWLGAAFILALLVLLAQVT